MTRAPNLLLVLAFLATAAPLDLSAWKYRKRIPLTPGDALSVVKLDRETYTGAAFDLGDLRIVRDGVEVPYLKEVLQNRESYVSKLAKPFDLSVIEGPAVQFTVNAGRTHHNRVRLETEEQNFRQKVRVEASADNRSWATLRSDGAIFDFTQDSRQFSSLAIDFPVSTKPFLRVTILGWGKTSAVKSVNVDYEVRKPAVREALATVTPQITEDSKSQETLATLDLGVEGLPIDHFVLSSTSPQFQRAVNVETSGDAKEWTYVGQGVIARLPGPDYTEESLAISIPETHQRYLRIRIYNRDDQAIQVGQVRLEGLMCYMNFLSPSPGDYWLYYGNAGAHSPSYDLPAVLAHRESTRKVFWTLDPAQPNAAYRPAPAPKKPWSEEHPAILYTALGVAVLALAITTIRFASRLRPSSQ